MSNQSLFDQMASLVRVRHVQLPLGPSFPSKTPLEEIEVFLQGCVEDHNYPVDMICVVLQDGQPVGWFDTLAASGEIESWIAEVPGGVLGDVIDGISLSQVIAADVPFLEAAELLSADDYPFFRLVLDGTRLSGWINYFCLFGPPGTMCIFALMMELEAACLDLSRAFSEQCWSVLSETRRNKATDVWRKRVEHPKEMDALQQRCKLHGGKALMDSLIECTTFIDKAKMIGKCKLLVDWGRDKLDSILNRAEQVRNACAHPAENGRLAAILPRERFGNFLKDCRRLIESIRTVTPHETPNSSSEN